MEIPLSGRIILHFIAIFTLFFVCFCFCHSMAYVRKFIKNYFLSLHAENTAEKKSPEFLKGLQDQEVIEGNEVKFRCKLSGYPQPRVIWYKDGKKIKNSEQYRIGEFSIIYLFKCSRKQPDIHCHFYLPIYEQ